MLKIGILKEFKSNEGRVMLSPEGVKVLVKNDIEVFVEQSAGSGCHFSDLKYEQAGAKILPTMEKIAQQSEILLKVSPPQPIEFELLNENHSYISFYNILNYKDERFDALLNTKASIYSAELIQDETGNYPFLSGMSEIAGHLAVNQAANLLTISAGGKGKLLAGTELSKPANITIIGAGKVGRTAAKIALSSGAQVKLFGLKAKKIEQISKEIPEAQVSFYSEDELIRVLPETDVLIVSVYSLKKQYDMHISRETIGLMEAGSVILDISIDQTKILESSHLTNFEDPTFILDGIVHYCVPNISGAVPFTSSRVITKRILPFLKTLTKGDLKASLVEQPGLLTSLCTYKGKVTQRVFAERFNKEFYNIFELLELNL